MVDLINKGDRHTNEQINTITPPPGDVLMDVTKNVLVIGDGITKGGNPMMQGFISKKANGDITLGNENIIFVNATSGNIVITLPQIASYPNKVYTINRVDSSSNTVTITPNGAETISKEASQTISPDDCMVITPYETDWRII